MTCTTRMWNGSGRRREAGRWLRERFAAIGKNRTLGTEGCGTHLRRECLAVIGKNAPFGTEGSFEAQAPATPAKRKAPGLRRLFEAAKAHPVGRLSPRDTADTWATKTSSILEGSVPKYGLFVRG